MKVLVTKFYDDCTESDSLLLLNADFVDLLHRTAEQARKDGLESVVMPSTDLPTCGVYLEGYYLYRAYDEHKGAPQGVVDALKALLDFANGPDESALLEFAVSPEELLSTIREYTEEAISVSLGDFIVFWFGHLHLLPDKTAFRGVFHPYYWQVSPYAVHIDLPRRLREGGSCE